MTPSAPARRPKDAHFLRGLSDYDLVRSPLKTKMWVRSRASVFIAGLGGFPTPRAFTPKFNAKSNALYLVPDIDHIGAAGYHADMGVTRVQAVISNLADPSRRGEIEWMVDSGAVYTVAPARTLASLDIAPHSERTFILADGRQVTWPVGDAGFAIGSRQGASVVVFGQDDSPALLGVATLEELGLGLDPVRRELIPVPLPLFRVRPDGQAA